MDLQLFLHFIANILSLITIGMSLFLKVPQILKISDNKSAVGISVLGLMLELTSYTIMMCYNFTNGYSLLSYLEYPIILLQEYILIFLVLKYLNIIDKSLLIAVLYFIMFICFLCQILPKSILTILAPLCTPISAFGKIAQLLAIIKARNADSVSPKTWFISAFTNLTRLFTIYMDSADLVLISNFSISVLLSSSVMFASLYYRSQPKKIE